MEVWRLGTRPPSIAGAGAIGGGARRCCILLSFRWCHIVGLPTECIGYVSMYFGVEFLIKAGGIGVEN